MALQQAFVNIDIYWEITGWQMVGVFTKYSTRYLFINIYECKLKFTLKLKALEKIFQHETGPDLVEHCDPPHTPGPPHPQHDHGHIASPLAGTH